MLLAVLAGLLVSVPAEAAPAAADPSLLSCWNPAPADWTRINHQFHSCADCRRAGEAGVDRGDWADYRCRVIPVGLDIVYYLYIPPAL